MGRRSRGQKVDDYDDSLERTFVAKRSKSENESSNNKTRGGGGGGGNDSPSEQHQNSSNKNSSKNDNANKNDNDNKNVNDKDNIERLREKKRLKKLRQKEKKVAAEKEEEKLKILREKQRKEREKQKVQRNKRKALEQNVSTDPNKFEKTSMGVRYIDVVVGRGPVLVDRKKVVCQYVLRANDKKGKLLDSGDKFAFRVGRGEVIKGWDIGLKGMRQGGRRDIIVPPRAGYGDKDIGGGKGAMLYFEVTLLQC